MSEKKSGKKVSVRSIIAHVVLIFLSFLCLFFFYSTLQVFIDSHICA